MAPLVPDPGQLPQMYRVVEVRIENPTIRSFVLSDRMQAAPGQFVMAWLPGLNEKPFSPSCADPLTLTVERVGPFTTAMHALLPGDHIWLRGPFGRGFALRNGPMMAIGGGCGTPPLLHLAQVARQARREVHAVLGARTAESLLFQDRFADLGCAVHVATDDGSAGHRGTAVGFARWLLDEQSLPAEELCACGPAPMLRAVYDLAHDHRLLCQLSYEAYMRCGIGVCGSCAVGGCLVCRDGPVLNHPPQLSER